MATRWKGMITTKAPKSSLEALAFLLFVVAYGLKKLINQEETALLASSIAQYQQAPLLFNSLGVELEIIPEFVNKLVKKSEYIPAVRLICLFNLNKDLSFSASEILTKEVMNLRWHAFHEIERSTESSEVNQSVVGRLRALLELVADYNLKVDIPGDLIATLTDRRKHSDPSISSFCGGLHLLNKSTKLILLILLQLNI